MRWVNSAHVTLAAVALLASIQVVLIAQESPHGQSVRRFRPANDPRDEAEDYTKRRLREGTIFTDKGGHFRQDGDGAVFVSEDKHELGVLENLNLERVVRTLKGSDESDSIRWSVSGTVTEFNGRNFLLLTRAVYKSASPPPAPDQLLN